MTEIRKSFLQGPIAYSPSPIKVRWLRLWIFFFILTLAAISPVDSQSGYRAVKKGAKPILTLQDANHPAISADGRLIAVGPEIGVTEVYEVATGRKLHTFRIPRSYSQAISADGKRIAVFARKITGYEGSNYSSEVEMWVFDAVSGKEIRRTNTKILHKGEVLGEMSVFQERGKLSRNISSDLRFMANDPKYEENPPPDKHGILLGDVETHELVRGFGGYNMPGYWHNLKLTPDARRLAAAWSYEKDRQTVVWDVESGRELLKLPFDCWWLVLSDDGKRLVTVHRDSGSGETAAFSVTAEGEVRVESVEGKAKTEERESLLRAQAWDIATGRRISEIGAQFGNKRRPMVWGALSPDGKLFVTSSHENMLLWDVDTGRLLAEQPIVEPQRHDFKTVLFSGDGRYIAMSSWDEIVKVFRVEDLLRDAGVSK